MYDTKEEAFQKLSQTVCLFNNNPVIIDEANGKGDKLTLKYRMLRTGEVRSNLISDPGWEFRNLGPRLGYVNASFGMVREALYLVRSAVRVCHSTQCLSFKNVIVPYSKGSKKLGVPSVDTSFSNLSFTHEFCDMLEQKYPTLEDLSKSFENDTVISLAFSREFAVYRPDVGPFILEYKGKSIGYSDDLSEWKIHKDYSYLNETAETMNLKVKHA